ncbi:MAG: hypothetical protein IMZ66_01585 [Planctomycetes bacterium]|nr:hypothetical protein [Planctomycetota bacterium]
MRTVGGLLAVALAAAAVSGCGQSAYTRSDRYEEGLVVCLSGAGGMMGETDRLREGLNAGRVFRAIEAFEWSGGGVLSDQTDVDANHRKAAELAGRIETYQRSYPGRPVHLIGVSAGTGLVVWALESLGPESQVTGAILISSSLDTKYDLSKALAKVTDRLYSFNSVADTVLSLGVTLTGTVDRGGGPAGGLVGFSPPNSAGTDAKALYKEKLIEISWWPGDVVLGHLGDHLGATNPAYIREKIAPLVLGKEPEAGGETPSDAVKKDQPRTAAYAKIVEQRRKEEEAKQQAEKEKAADAKAAAEAAKEPPAKEPPATEPPAKEPPAKDIQPQSRRKGGGRFIEWNVGRRPAEGQTSAPARAPVDVSQFFADPRSLP